jgi:hypothetical protein
LFIDPVQTASAMYAVAMQMRIHTEFSNHPAAFVTDQHGIIQRRAKTFSDRPRPADLLEELARNWPAKSAARESGSMKANQISVIVSPNPASRVRTVNRSQLVEHGLVQNRLALNRMERSGLDFHSCPSRTCLTYSQLMPSTEHLS